MTTDDDDSTFNCFFFGILQNTSSYSYKLESTLIPISITEILGLGVPPRQYIMSVLKTTTKLIRKNTRGEKKYLQRKLEGHKE